MRYRTPLFILTISIFFLPCGTMLTTRFLCAGDVTAAQASDSVKTTESAWTRVHAIINQSTCAKSRVSGDDRRAYLVTRGGAKSVRSSS